MSERSSAYTRAGVDIKAADEFIGSIKDIVSATFTKNVITDIGGFGGLFRLPGNLENPVLVASTDGVGTKLKLAFAFDVHHTIGLDLVAMSANDVLVQGARPLFFLDYFACGRLEGDKARAVVQGIARGCQEAGCALLGGETAEMPGFYPDGEYDLSGFCVGAVDNDHIVDGSSAHVGDVLIGLAASGLHSNGFSLVRELLDQSGLAPADPFPDTDQTVAQELLEPTRIYVKPVLSLLRDPFELGIKGMVHVTGGGFYDNIPRVLSPQAAVSVDFGSWPVPGVFQWVKRTGGLDWEEMLQIFNCGIGYIIIASADKVQEIVDRLAGAGQEAWPIGRVSRHDGGERVRFTGLT
jgi:phosphoribosylformylglycinamidine cyclo-ligase